MTPALKAMVNAMVGEIERQGQLARLVCPPRISTSPLPGGALAQPVYIEGGVDLIEVARAGLAAIREPADDVRAGIEAADIAANPFIGTACEGVPADPADGDDHWRFAIDAILKGQP